MAHHACVPHSKLGMGHATNLAWAMQQCSMASTVVLRGTTPKMPHVCEAINGLCCMYVFVYLFVFLHPREQMAYAKSILYVRNEG